MRLRAMGFVSASMGWRGEIGRAQPAVHAAPALAGWCASDGRWLLITHVNLYVACTSGQAGTGGHGPPDGAC